MNIVKSNYCALFCDHLQHPANMNSGITAEMHITTQVDMNKDTAGERGQR